MPNARPFAVLAAALCLALLTGCTPTPVKVADELTIGTTGALTLLDPAAASDDASVAILSQVHPHLLAERPGDAEAVPDLAESAGFTSPTEYTVTLKPGLTFANGHELSASDVKFSIDRQLVIAEPEGPSLYLYNVVDVAADDLTVTFTLGTADDVLFPRVLASAAGSIVDEEVFSADAISPDADIIAGNAFGGPYAVTDFSYQSATTLTAVPGYGGLGGAGKTDTITVRYFASDEELAAALGNGDVQLTLGTIDPAAFAAAQVVTGPGRYSESLVFNLATQPYGTATADADAAKASAVREAVSLVADREALAKVTAGASIPLLSFVPAGLEGSVDNLPPVPDPATAAVVLEEAGVEVPVPLELSAVTDQYGPLSSEVYTALAAQLTDSGLFEATSVSALWTEYSKRRLDDGYAAYQFRWRPEVPATDLYLTELFGSSMLLGNHYANAEVESLVLAIAAEPDADARGRLIAQVQDALAADIPVLPLLQSAQVVATNGAVDGLELDASQLVRFAALSTPAAAAK
jgi:peptide/nickel transport system substrate-binding protein